MVKIRHKLLKGLSSALLVLFLAALCVVDAQCATTDDLKAYLGYTVEKLNLNKEELSEMDVMQNSITNYTKEKSAIEGKISELRNQRNSLSDEIRSKFESASTANSILLSIKSIEAIDIKLDTEISNGKEVSMRIEHINKIMSAYNVVDTSGIEESEAYNFDIGEIGTSKITAVGENPVIVTPYGYRINTDGSIEEKKNSVSLKIQSGNDVYAQWNGVITNIFKEDGKDVIEIYHGNNVYTTYRNVITTLKMNDKVQQGEVIGKAGNSKAYEYTKDNHIEFEICIDGTFVNPILVYGRDSERIFNDWLKSAYETYTIEKGEHYYYIKEISKDNPNKWPDGTYDEDMAYVVGEYSKPDPGIVTG